MADTKISALASGGTIQDGDEFVVVRAAANFKASYATPAAGTVLSGYTTSGRTVDAAIMYNGSGYTVARKVWAEDDAETWVVNGEYLEIDLPTEHDDIEIELNGVYWQGSLNDDGVTVQVSDDNKSTWENGAGYYSHKLQGIDRAGAANTATNASNTFAFLCQVENSATSAEDGVFGYIRIRRIGNKISGFGQLQQGDNPLTNFQFITRGATSPATNIRIYASAGGVTAGVNWATKATMGDGAIKVLTK